MSDVIFNQLDVDGNSYPWRLVTDSIFSTCILKRPETMILFDLDKKEVVYSLQIEIRSAQLLLDEPNDRMISRFISERCLYPINTNVDIV